MRRLDVGAVRILTLLATTTLAARDGLARGDSGLAQVRNDQEAARLAQNWLVGLKSFRDVRLSEVPGEGTPLLNIHLSDKCPARANVLTKVRKLELCLAKDAVLMAAVPDDPTAIAVTGVFRNRDVPKIVAHRPTVRDRFPAGLTALRRLSTEDSVYFVQLELSADAPGPMRFYEMVVAVQTYPAGQETHGMVVGAVANIARISSDD